MSEFEVETVMPETQDRSETADEAVTAKAQLPGLEIEIMHRRAPEADAELMTINVRAVPSFEQFGRALEAANPLALWTQAVRLIWMPWLSWMTAVQGALPAAGEVAKLSHHRRTDGGA
jgi:hypothetical protein